MSTHISVPPQLLLERILTLEIVRVTERAAVSAARLRGHGNEKAADQAAVDAMRRELNKLPIEGTVVIGEGERDEAPMLFIGEKVGHQCRSAGRYRRRSARGHHAVRQEHAGLDRDHGDGRRRHAASRARRLHAEDRGRPRLLPKASSNSTPRPPTTSAGWPRPRGSTPRRSRCWCSIVRATPTSSRACAHGAAVRLITDGDVAGVIHCADPENTGVDMYIGTGGAPEGVLAAVALRCIGGQMQCRLILDTEEKRERARKMGVTDPRMIYGIEDMARGDCLFAATGVTDRLAAVGRQVPQGCDRDRNRGDAFGHRHRALHQGRASPARKISPRLSKDSILSFRDTRSVDSGAQVRT